MPSTSRFLTALRRVIRPFGSSSNSSSNSNSTSISTADAAPVAVTAVRVEADLLEVDGSSGRSGPDATIEIDPRRLGRVRPAYRPEDDDAPDPGEIIWTWVPYEERDGRGKDRPVVVVAASEQGDYLAVALTSTPHEGDAEYVPLGTGEWDHQGRPSWAKIDRLFRVRAAGMRREAAALDADRYQRLVGALSARYGWN